MAFLTEETHLIKVSLLHQQFCSCSIYAYFQVSMIQGFQNLFGHIHSWLQLVIVQSDFCSHDSAYLLSSKAICLLSCKYGKAVCQQDDCIQVLNHSHNPIKKLVPDKLWKNTSTFKTRLFLACDAITYYYCQSHI